MEEKNTDILKDGFWMVYVEHGDMPSKKHFSEEAALAEAERLTISTNKKTFVFHAKAVKVSTPPVKVVFTDI